MGRSAPASRNAKVCEDHFEAKEFKTDLVNGRRKLKANAVPSLLLNAEWNLPTTETRDADIAPSPEVHSGVLSDSVVLMPEPAAKPPCDAPQAETVELHESGLNREKKPELTSYLEQKKCWKTEEERGTVRQSTSHTFIADQIRTSEKGTIGGSSSWDATVPNALSTKTVCGSKGCEYVKENMVPVPAPRTLHKPVECTEFFPSDGGACSKDVGCLPEPTTDILFKCCFCTHVTRDQRGILDHLVFHNCEQQLKCQHCPKYFSKGENLGCHTEIHKPEKTFECKLCPAEFQKNSDLVSHIQTHTGKNHFRCGECLKVFAQVSSLSFHMQSHRGEKPYKCQQCPEAFAWKGALLHHIKAHASNRSFKCTSCPKSFVRSRDCTAHMRTHAGDRPYKCVQCHKAFTQKPTLSRHMRIHKREVPYKCKWCPLSFSRSEK
uniref:Regulation of transcription n=1 Tax=Ixodes ricinus TaxID=34613 RepID=A0A131XT82_IXORI